MSTTLPRAESVAAATPASRDRVIDFLRAMSLVVVIFGHWLMASVTVTETPTGATIAGENALTSIPLLQPATWLLQVMPLFFMAGGFANLTVWRSIQRRGGGYANFLYGRLNRLVRPTLVFVISIPLLLAALQAAGVGAAEVSLVGGLLGQPLWFLGVFVGVTALAPAMALAHARRPVSTVVALGAAAVVVDVARMTWLEPVGYLNLIVVWLLVQQLGFWYSDGKLAEISRSVWKAILATCVGALVALTVVGPYPVSMVGLPGEMSNMAPPSICLVVLAVAQTAIVMLVRDPLASWLKRPRPWSAIVTVGSVAMTIYLWHLAVLVAGFGVTVIAGISIPEPGTASWWLSRPLWLAVLTVGLAAIAFGMSRFERVAGGNGYLQVSTRGQLAAASLGGLAVAVGLLGYVLDGLELTSVRPAVNALLLVAGLVVAQLATSISSVSPPPTEQGNSRASVTSPPAARAPSIPA